MGQNAAVDFIEQSDSQRPQPIRFGVPFDDGVIAGWRWKNEGKPPLLFCHATGFCASVYQQMLGRLSADFNIYAMDLRGHGHTTLRADAPGLRSWNIYASDLRGFLDAHPHPDWTLAGHSMGAVTAALAARGRTDITALRLMEPVAMAPWMVLAAKSPIWFLAREMIPLVKSAANRRAQWPDKETARRAYSGKALFSSWAPGMLEDYLQDGLVEAAGEFRLACAPEWEAATFGAQANDFWTAVRAAPCPVRVLAANHSSSTVSESARRRLARCANVTAVDGVSHLFPMERPGLAAKFVAGPQ